VANGKQLVVLRVWMNQRTYHCSYTSGDFSTQYLLHGCCLVTVQYSTGSWRRNRKCSELLTYLDNNSSGADRSNSMPSVPIEHSITNDMPFLLSNCGSGVVNISVLVYSLSSGIPACSNFSDNSFHRSLSVRPSTIIPALQFHQRYSCSSS